MEKKAIGLRSDCETFVKRFKDESNLRYETFSSIWRDLKFSFVFYGKETEGELVEFTEECLVIAKNIWLSRSNIQERVCGFFLLYAFYMKQPTKSKVKIRLTAAEWTECRDFVKNIYDDKHWDIYFVFLKLFKTHAFHFVLLPLEIYPGVGAQQQENEGTKRENKTVDNLTNFMEDKTFKELIYLAEQYNTEKDAVSNEFHGEESSLRMADPNIEEIITKLVTTGIKKPNNSKMSDSDDEIAKEDIGSRRTRIKNVQFANPCADHRASTSKVHKDSSRKDGGDLPSTSKTATKRRRQAKDK